MNILIKHFCSKCFIKNIFYICPFSFLSSISLYPMMVHLSTMLLPLKRACTILMLYYIIGSIESQRVEQHIYNNQLR